MQPVKRKPWGATLVSAGCIPILWLFAYTWADGVRCGFSHAEVVAIVGALYISLVVASAVLVAAIVLNAWRGIFPLRWWLGICGLLAFAAPIVGVYLGLWGAHDPMRCFMDF
jgi:hypothetical protein